jgi:hypothetical protein
MILFEDLTVLQRQQAASFIRFLLLLHQSQYSALFIASDR